MLQKTALVVGGTSGIGLGVARSLLQRKVKTFIVGRRNFNDEEKIDSNFNFIQVDLTSADAIDKIKQRLSNLKLDYVVFSVATEAPLKKYSDISSEEYDYALLLNLKMPFFLTKALLENLNQNARLLYLTSRLSSAPEEGSLVYCMTKSAIEIFSLGINKN